MNRNNMKTIETAARNYCNIDLNLVLDEEERYYKDFQKYDGFKAGVEFAQRWIPVEEEKPENMKSVLVMDNGCSPIRCIALFLDNEFYPDFKVLKHENITHWRPIDYV
jgi:hypothetical protein